MAAVARQLLALTRRLDRSATSRVDADQSPEEPGRTEGDIDAVLPDSTQVAPSGGPMRPGGILDAISRRGLRRRLLLLALLLTAVGAGLVAAIWPDDEPAVAATIKIGEVTEGNADAPISVGVAGKDVVVLTYDGLLRIDADRNARANGLWRDLHVGAQGMSVASNALWLTTSTRKPPVRALRFTRNGLLGHEVELTKAHRVDKSARTGVSIDAHDAWVIDGTRTVRAFDHATNAPSHVAVLSARTEGGTKLLPQAIFAGERSVWVAARTDRRALVYRIKRSAKRTLRATPTAYVGTLGDLAVVESKGSAWVVNSSANAVTRLDAQTGKVIGRPIPVGSSPQAIAAGFGAVWVANTGSGSVSRIDAARGEAVDAWIRVGPHPAAVAVGAGAVWVASKGLDPEQGHTLTRIDP
jgi:streptogramin lyase